MFVFFFFFSSRRRHTRLQGDWSSDVCSSDLQWYLRRCRRCCWFPLYCCRSEERRVGKSVDLGGRRIIKKKKKKKRKNEIKEKRKKKHTIDQAKQACGT